MIERWGWELVVIAIRVELLNTDGRPLARKNFRHPLADAGSKAQTSHGPAAIAALVDKDRTRYNLEDIANRAAAKSLPRRERRLND